MEGKEKEGEKQICGCLLCAPYWGSGLQPRHVPDPQWNWWPFGFGSQASAQSTKPHQTGWFLGFKINFFTFDKITGIKFHFTILSYIKYKLLMLGWKVIFKRKYEIQDLNTVGSADRTVVVILCKWDKICGLAGKDSIFGQSLPAVVEFGKLTTSFSLLLKSLGLDRWML